MPQQLITTKELSGMRVVMHGRKNGHRVGKVHRFVFHPKEKRVIGFTVKRPDLAFMFHRKDMFVSLDGYDVEDGRIMVRDESDARDRGAVKALGVDYDACVLWVGMPVMTQSGETLGYVGTVTFDRTTGAVLSVQVDDGVANDAVVGKRIVPADLVKGFRTGQGAALAPMGEYGAQENEDVLLGAIMVSDEAASIVTEGGAANAAGKATAAAVGSVKSVVDEAKPAIDEAARAAGRVVNKGAYATGKQLGQAKGMFSAFKREYDRARRDG